MHTRLIEFYRFDLPSDSIHTLNNIVSSSLGLDCPSIFFLADRQDIRRIRSRHNSQSISAMYGFDMIAAYSYRESLTLIYEGSRTLFLVARPISVQQIDRTAIRVIPNRETDGRSRLHPSLYRLPHRQSWLQSLSWLPRSQLSTLFRQDRLSGGNR